MRKYHVNDNGDVKSCGATGGRCPYASRDEERHFSTKSEALSASEEILSNHLNSLNRVSKTFKKSEISPALNSVLDVNLMNRMIEDKYVLSSSHPDDDTLKILCYGRSAQFDGKWNEATKLARGLIIQTSDEKLNDAVIVQRPWKKFFTLSQLDNNWHLGDEEDQAEDSASNELELLDFSAPAEVTDKMDGSMGVLYIDPNGKPALSTKGSFKSEQAEYYTNMLQRNEKFYNAADSLLTNHPDTTFTFELISSGEYQIVLDYDRDDISMIGAIKKSNGIYHSVSDYKNIWNPELGLTSAESMPAKNIEEAFSMPDREGREGVVVRIISDDPDKQMQIKIKQEDYLKLHKSRTTFSKKDIRAVLRDTHATYGDLLKVAESRDISYFPEVHDQVIEQPNAGTQAEIFRKKRIAAFEKSIFKAVDDFSKAKNYVDNLPDELFAKEENQAKKEFAKSIASNKELNKGMLFKVFNARFNNIDLHDVNANDVMRAASQQV